MDPRSVLGITTNIKTSKLTMGETVHRNCGFLDSIIGSRFRVPGFVNLGMGRPTIGVIYNCTDTIMICRNILYFEGGSIIYCQSTGGHTPHQIRPHWVRSYQTTQDKIREEMMGLWTEQSIGAMLHAIRLHSVHPADLPYTLSLKIIV